MSQIETVLFSCDGILIDNEVICSRVYITMFREFDIHVDLEEISTRSKGIKLYEVIDVISKEQGVTVVQTDTGHVCRAEVVCLFGTEPKDITEANELLAGINVLIYVVSNGPVSKIQHSLSKLNILHYFPEKLFDGYNIQRQEPDPTLMFYAAKAIDVNVENCILIDSSNAGAQPGIDAGAEVFYFCTNSHNKPIVHPKVTAFTHLLQLSELWKVRGWDITAQLFTLPSLTLLKLAHKGK